MNSIQEIKNNLPFCGVCNAIDNIRCYYELHCKKNKKKEKKDI